MTMFLHPDLARTLFPTTAVPVSSAKRVDLAPVASTSERAATDDDPPPRPGRGGGRRSHYARRR